QAPTVTLGVSVSDEDPAAPGFQVKDGTTVRVRAAVTDDVQVRNVELLLDGEVVANDVSFPWDSFAVAPTFASRPGPITLQLRATDTGGNSALSAPFVFNLIPERVPPALVAVDPAEGAGVPEGREMIQLRFS